MLNSQDLWILVTLVKNSWKRKLFLIKMPLRVQLKLYFHHKENWTAQIENNNANMSRLLIALITAFFYDDVPLITQELRYEKIASKESTLNCIGRWSRSLLQVTRFTVCDDMRQACGKELCMRQHVGDSFPADEICHLISGYISQFTCKAHITAPLTSQKISVCCLQNAGPFTMEKVLWKHSRKCHMHLNGGRWALKPK